MSKEYKYQEIALADLIKRRKDELEVQDFDSYKRLTIHMDGQGISIRDQVPGSLIGTKHQFKVKSNQFILSKIDARNGAFGIVPKEGEGAIITGNFWAFDVDYERLDVKFFNYLTKTPLFIDFCTRASDGTTNRRYLREEKFLSQKIVLPPLEEQRRIVARIEELAAKIEEARGLRKQVQDELYMLRRSAFFEATKKKPKLTAMKELLHLRELDVFVEPEKTYYFAGVYSFGKGMFKGQRRVGTEFSYAKLTRLKTNNFVYPKLMAWEGALAIVPPECNDLVVSPEFPVFEVNEDKVLPETLEVYFQFPDVWPLLSGASTGTNVRRKRLNPSEFFAFEMPLPSMETQILLKELSQRTKIINRYHADISAELDALLPSILDRAFKGEL